MDKLFIEIYFPQTKTTHDFKVPRDITIGEMKYMIVFLIEKKISKKFFIEFEYELLDYKTGESLDDSKFLYETNIKNGSKLLLM